jgi:hypothetical protein
MDSTHITLNDLPTLVMTYNSARNLMVLSFGIVLVKLIQQGLVVDNPDLEGYSDFGDHISCCEVKNTIDILNRTRTEADVIATVLFDQTSLFHRLVVTDDDEKFFIVHLYEDKYRDNMPVIDKLRMRSATFLPKIDYLQNNKYISTVDCFGNFMRLTKILKLYVEGSVGIKDTDKKGFIDNNIEIMLNQLIEFLRNEGFMLTVAGYRCYRDPNDDEYFENCIYVTDDDLNYIDRNGLGYHILNDFVTMQQRHEYEINPEAVDESPVDDHKDDIVTDEAEIKDDESQPQDSVEQRKSDEDEVDSKVVNEEPVNNHEDDIVTDEAEINDDESRPQDSVEQRKSDEDDSEVINEEAVDDIKEEIHNEREHLMNENRIEEVREQIKTLSDHTTTNQFKRKKKDFTFIFPLILFLIIAPLSNIFAWANIIPITTMMTKILLSCVGSVIGIVCLVVAIGVGYKDKVCDSCCQNSLAKNLSQHQENDTGQLSSRKDTESLI